MKLRTVLPIALCTCAASMLPAAAPTSPAAQLRANVTEVSENRTTGSFPARCVLDLTLTGDPAYDATSVLKVRLDRAVDDLDRDLVPRRTEENFPQNFQNTGGALKAKVSLKAASRSATTIKLVQGQVDLFTPTESNGGILLIPNVLAHPAEQIANPVLKENEIQLMYVTKEAAEAKRKEMADKQSSDPFAEAVRNLFSGGFGGMGDAKPSVAIAVSDPQKRIVSMELQDAKGTRLQTHSTMTSPGFVRIVLEAPPPADTRLIVQVAVPAAVQSYPFAIENIPLP